ncbi:hypothetical protein [Rhizobium sp.]|uniref:hypothetical protein n=1 Tax=Rhizobium sp. TaxID=391 RepID=UPI00289FF01D
MRPALSELAATISEGTDMSYRKPDPESDAARSDPELADRNRKELAKKAEEGLKNANDELPKDQI